MAKALLAEHMPDDGRVLLKTAILADEVHGRNQAEERLPAQGLTQQRLAAKAFQEIDNNACVDLKCSSRVTLRTLQFTKRFTILDFHIKQALDVSSSGNWKSRSYNFE